MTRNIPIVLQKGVKIISIFFPHLTTPIQTHDDEEGGFSLWCSHAI